MASKNLTTALLSPPQEARSASRSAHPWHVASGQDQQTRVPQLNEGKHRKQEQTLAPAHQRTVRARSGGGFRLPAAPRVTCQQWGVQ